jgi:serine/threonine protein kinase
VPPLAPAVLVNRYRLDHQLCSTPTVQVWRGTDVLLRRTVVIRVLLATDDDASARFLAKARLTGSVSHHGITKVYDFEDSRPEFPPFLVSEYIDGVSLADLIAAGPIQFTTVLDMVTQAAEALHIAHQAGLRHGAIKPANVLITRDGGIKLTDFGGAPMTPYRAPELADGSPATVAGDIYGLGVIARECLASTSCEVVEAEALFASLTGTEPQRRPADAGVLSADAARILFQHSLPQPPRPRFRPWQFAPAA